MNVKRAPYPFLWPSLPSAPATCPHTLPPIITANPKSLWDRFYIAVMSLPVRVPSLNRALNIGWIAMLLTRAVFPRTFLYGSLIGFEELLRRLRAGEDARDLLTPQFADYLYTYLTSSTELDAVKDRAYIICPRSGGGMTVRDAWVFIGNPSSFASSLNKFGGMLRSKATDDPKSSTLFLQLPFTSLVQESDMETPLGLEAEAGLQVAVDIEIRGLFKYGFRGEEMSEERTAIVRYVSQVFEPKKCRTTEEKNRRIFSIRDNIRWSIADIDYVWSQENLHKLE